VKKRAQPRALARWRVALLEAGNTCAAALRRTSDAREAVGVAHTVAPEGKFRLFELNPFMVMNHRPCGMKQSNS
jgi:hypothetical protein